MNNDYKITYTFEIQAPEEFYSQQTDNYPDVVEDTKLAQDMLKNIGALK